MAEGEAQAVPERPGQDLLLAMLGGQGDQTLLPHHRSAPVRVIR